VAPFHYLVWVQQNKEEVAKNPELFLPWNYSQEKTMPLF